MDLSLIIVCYNQADLLKRAVASVMVQEHLPDEIIIADDCSTDESVAVANALAAQSRRIRVIARERNLGVSANRDLAIREAKGKVFTTLDADDTLMPGKLEAEYDLLMSDGDAVVISDTLLIDRHEVCVGVVASLATATLAQQSRVAKLAMQRVPTAKDPMLRTENFIAVGGLRHHLTRYEDLDLQLRLADAFPAWRSTAKPGTAYRMSGGLTRDHRVGHLKSDLEVLIANSDLLQRRFGRDALTLCARARADARLGIDGTPAAGAP